MKRRYLFLLTLLLVSVLISGCVHYRKRPEETRRPTQEATQATTESSIPTSGSDLPTASEEPTEQEPFTDADGFPNPTGDGETKRY